jgi:hypothetical protein
VAWLREVAHGLLDALPGEVHDVYAQKWEAYAGSPLRRLLRAGEALLTQVLRDLTLRTARAQAHIMPRKLPTEQVAHAQHCRSSSIHQAMS